MSDTPRRVRPGFLAALGVSLLLPALVLGIQAVVEAHEAADLAVASERLADVRWPADYRESDVGCPRTAACFVVHDEPERVAHEVLDALAAEGFDTEAAGCEEADQRGSCSGYARSGRAQVAVAVVAQEPVAESSLVRVSQPFSP